MWVLCSHFLLFPFAQKQDFFQENFILGQLSKPDLRVLAQNSVYGYTNANSFIPVKV